MAAEVVVKLAAFDWTGTLADFGACGPATAYVKAFAARGIPVTLATARAPTGLPRKEHVRVMLTDPIVGCCWRATFGRGWTMPDVNDLDRLVAPLQAEAARQCGRLVPGAAAAVAWLREHGVAVAVATGYSRDAAAAAFAAAAEQDFEPDVALCLDDVRAGPPEPWLVYRAMEATRVFPPAAVVRLGDTRTDVEDARNAGAWAVGVVDAGNDMGLAADEFAALPDDVRDAKRAAVRARLLAAGAHATIDSLAEVPPLVAALNERLAAGERP